jgi:hypothetical protein
VERVGDLTRLSLLLLAVLAGGCVSPLEAEPPSPSSGQAADPDEDPSRPESTPHPEPERLAALDFTLQDCAILEAGSHERPGPGPLTPPPGWAVGSTHVHLVDLFACNRLLTETLSRPVQFVVESIGTGTQPAQCTYAPVVGILNRIYVSDPDFAMLLAERGIPVAKRSFDYSSSDGSLRWSWTSPNGTSHVTTTSRPDLPRTGGVLMSYYWGVDELHALSFRITYGGTDQAAVPLQFGEFASDMLYSGPQLLAGGLWGVSHTVHGTYPGPGVCS